MANWNNPTLTSLYTDFLADLKSRDEDAVTMFASAGSNIPTNSKRWNSVSFKFQNWNGASWDDLLLSVAGGGTGGATASDARTNLGLGTMATQSNSAVNITGGTISGVTMAASVITSGTIALNRGGTGASLSLGANGSVLQSNGSAVVFGTNGAALTTLNASNISSGNLAIARMPTGGTWNLTTGGLSITGDGLLMGVPTGGNQGPGTINATALYIQGVAVATGAGVPSGVIVLADSACPAGYTRYAALDGYILQGGAAFGTAGSSNTQTDDANIPVDNYNIGDGGGPPTYSVNSVQDVGGGNYGTHNHGLSLKLGTVVLCQKN